MGKIIFEACVDSVNSAVIAGTAGADRIELCSALDIGGLTPSYGLIKVTIERLTIPVNVLIRPRSGDFIYSREEFAVMKRDILFCRDLNVNGIVVGILNADGTIDKERISDLIDLARPMSLTFHRAFDFTSDPFKALDTLIELEADRILTSGLQINAYSGIDMIKKLVDYAKERIIIIPGGGINENNVREIVAKTGVKEIHASAREKLQSKTNYKIPNITLAGSGDDDQFPIKILSAVRVRKIIAAMEK
ncbi:MAG: copper homeostasis protein CutC [Bacteroidota bacterium]|jgi:copper homeostasis protein